MKGKQTVKVSSDENLEPEIEAEMLIQTVASVFHDLMEQQGLDKVKLTKLLKCSRPYTTQLLRGDRNMSLRTLSKLAYALGVRITVGVEPLARFKKQSWAQPVASVRMRHRYKRRANAG
ncbi:MAG TPA: helix-turn-helix transcriptional regulator [Candidatus Binatia bacterium]|nr:helix-turn-helix transcriptional regulator [Candidatus Binatia bacterium]